jgi:hypothetical protein
MTSGPRYLPATVHCAIGASTFEHPYLPNQFSGAPEEKYTEKNVRDITMASIQPESISHNDV